MRGSCFPKEKWSIFVRMAEGQLSPGKPKSQISPTTVVHNQELFCSSGDPCQKSKDIFDCYTLGQGSCGGIRER